MINLYWPVYKNLEKDVIELSNQVHFDDKQLVIYSVKIAELLIRCSVEIEAISKDLYFKLGGIETPGTELYFDTDCLQFIEEKWILSKKKLIMSAPNFYFLNDENRIITPLYKANKRGASGSDWKKAYQAVKHNRTLNLQKGNIKNLLRALGALFILNIYFKDEVFNFGKDNNATNFPISLGSDIFSIKLHKLFTYDPDHIYGKKDDFDECIYLTRYTDESLQRNKKATEEMRYKQSELTQNHPKIKAYLESNSLKDYKGNNLIYDILGQEEFVNIVRIASQSTVDVFKNTEYEAILNKNI